MSDLPPSLLPPEDQRLVKLAVVLRHAMTEPSKPEPKTPFWRDLFSPAVLTTLITVVLGGWVGNCVVANYQERAKDKEQALIDHRQEVEHQISAVTAAYQLLGEAHYQAQAMVALTTPPYQAFNMRGADVKKIEKQRTAMTDAANAFLLRWEKEKYPTGTLLAYYHQKNPEIHRQWTAAADATEALLAAAQHEHGEYAKNPKAGYVAKIDAQEATFKAAVNALADALAKAHAETTGKS